MSIFAKISELLGVAALPFRAFGYELARFVYAQTPRTMPEEVIAARIVVFIFAIAAMGWADERYALELSPFLFMFFVAGFCFLVKLQNYLWALREEMNPPADDSKN